MSWTAHCDYHTQGNKHSLPRPMLLIQQHMIGNAVLAQSCHTHPTSELPNLSNLCPCCRNARSPSGSGAGAPAASGVESAPGDADSAAGAAKKAPRKLVTFWSRRTRSGKVARKTRYSWLDASPLGFTTSKLACIHGRCHRLVLAPPLSMLVMMVTMSTIGVDIATIITNMHASISVIAFTNSG